MRKGGAMQRGVQGGVVCRPALQPCEEAGLRRRWEVI